MLDILVATIDERRSPAGLQHIKGEYRLFKSSASPWAKAANDLLDRSENDVLFMDDDVELLPGSLDLIERYYDAADLFGINLIAANGPQGWYVQSCGHMLIPNEQGALSLQPYDALGMSVPVLAAHAGTCCMYIKRQAAQDKRVRFPETWTGVHHEDIYYCLSAWLAGYKVARLPCTGIHWSHPNGAGATKAVLPNFHSGREENMQALIAWANEQDIGGAVRDGRIPAGVWGMDGKPIHVEGISHGG